MLPTISAVCPRNIVPRAKVPSKCKSSNKSALFPQAAPCPISILGRTLYNTVNYDVTTKSVGRLIDVLISTGKESFILELKQGVDGTADTYVEDVQTSFNAVEMHLPGADFNILGSISNTMNETAEHRRQVFQQVQMW